MLIKLFPSAPPNFIVLAVLIFIGVLLNREAFMTEGLPVFLPSEQSFVYVELTGDGLVPELHQFYDGLAPRDVIKLTYPSLVENLTIDPLWTQQLRNGESLWLVIKDREISIVRRNWMKASHRVALAIPLHPDRMSLKDWTILPGIGDALAKRIENDRQKNGDFRHVDILTRVNGIGKKRIDSWKEFFDDV